MRNSFFTTFLIVLCFGAVGFISCNNNCNSADISRDSIAISTAANEYANDASSENCLAYKEALDEYIINYGNCDEVSENTIDVYQAQLDALNC